MWPKRYEVILIQLINQELYRLNSAFAFALSGLVTAEWLASVHTLACALKTLSQRTTASGVVVQRRASWYVSKESLANHFIPRFLHPGFNIDPISSRQVTNISHCSVVVTNYCIRPIGLARELHSSQTGEMLQAPSIHIHNMWESAQQSETHLYESDCYHYHHERSSEVQSLIKYTSVKMEYSWCIYCSLIINDKMNVIHVCNLLFF